MTRKLTVLLAVLTAIPALADRTDAQPLGTFTWRLEPFCNLVTVNVTQNGAVYTMDGYDDLCGGSQRAPVVGLATLNPDGTIGIGWNIVVDGAGLHVGGRVTLAGLSGPWNDSAGNSGHFVFGTATSGSPRPVPSGTSTIPPVFALLTDGGFLARGTIGAGTIPASGAGTRLMWHPAKGAFRVGAVTGNQWDDANVGTRSVAMGWNTVADGGLSTALGSGTRASGGNSTALGADTVADGGNSTAMGLATTASGPSSTAMGRSTTASGDFGTAMGHRSTASGEASTAFGFAVTASGMKSLAAGELSTASGSNSTAIGLAATADGPNSVAIGTLVTASGQGSVVLGVRASAAATANGSFVFGDRSTGPTGTLITSIVPNQFLVRAVGGVGFFTNSAQTSGLQLASGGSQWLTVSDVSMKHAFRDLDGDDVLAKLARMPVMEWSYKSQDASIRHAGPTAQDFNAAFGLGEDPLRIGTMDADGIALAAVKALEVRTRRLDDAASMFGERVAMLTRENDELRARLARLEALLDKR